MHATDTLSKIVSSRFLGNTLKISCKLD